MTLEKTSSTRTLNSNEEDRQKEDDGFPEERSHIPASTTTPQRDQDDRRNRFPPDGKHNQTREWIVGDQIVVERNLGGPGDDVRFSCLPFFSHFRLICLM